MPAKRLGALSEDPSGSNPTRLLPPVCMFTSTVLADCSLLLVLPATLLALGDTPCSNGMAVMVVPPLALTSEVAGLGTAAEGDTARAAGFALLEVGATELKRDGLAAMLLSLLSCECLLLMPAIASALVLTLPLRTSPVVTNDCTGEPPTPTLMLAERLVSVLKEEPLVFDAARSRLPETGCTP